MKRTLIAFLLIMLINLNCLLTVYAAEPPTSVAENQNYSNSQKTNTILILGATYAKSWHIKNMSSMEVINKSVIGQQTYQMLEHFEKDLNAVSPRGIIIWGFINDIFHSDGEYVMQSKLRKSRKNIADMIAIARSKGITPVLATEVTITTPDSMTGFFSDLLDKVKGRKNAQDKINSYVIHMNAWLKEYAYSEGVTVLDFQQILADED
ncbi:MAG: hypothetical protein OEY89_05390, partial [Gammaproteobacteria bacterium]|nr:hypothetical protein [Gammaproteobacteria bacterium]